MMQVVAAQNPTAGPWYRWGHLTSAQSSSDPTGVPGARSRPAGPALWRSKRSEARGAGSGDRPRAVFSHFLPTERRGRGSVCSQPAELGWKEGARNTCPAPMGWPGQALEQINPFCGGREDGGSCARGLCSLCAKPPLGFGHLCQPF